MDLSSLLDTTEPTSCEFLETTINLEVYTAGMSRLTHEETQKFRGIIQEYVPANEQAQRLRDALKVQESLATESPEEEEAKQVKLREIQAEFDRLDVGSVEQMRVILPMMLKGWSLNGEPMKRNGESFPPTAANLATVPDSLLLAVGQAAQAIWVRPTIPASEVGSVAAEMSESSQTEITTPLATSD